MFCNRNMRMYLITTSNYVRTMKRNSDSLEEQKKEIRLLYKTPEVFNLGFNEVYVLMVII